MSVCATRSEADAMVPVSLPSLDAALTVYTACLSPNDSTTLS